MGEDRNVRTAPDGAEFLSGGGRRHGRQNQQRALYSFFVRCTGVGSGNDWLPKDVKCQVLSECSAGGSNSSEECSGEDEFPDGQDSTSKRYVW